MFGFAIYNVKETVLKCNGHSVANSQFACTSGFVVGGYKATVSNTVLNCDSTNPLSARTVHLGTSGVRGQAS